MIKKAISLLLADCLLFSFCGCQVHQPQSSATAPETTLPTRKTWSTSLFPSQCSFSKLAYRNSQDTGTAAVGGAYRDLRKGQLISRSLLKPMPEV